MQYTYGNDQEVQRELEFEVSYIKEEPYRECTNFFSSEERAEAFVKRRNIQNYQIMFFGWK